MMKRKIMPLAFTVLCLCLCLVPSVGMIFRPSNEVIGNERQSAPPSFTNEDGSFNTEFFTGLGEYFEQHFAFRSELITADAGVMAGVFGSSNLDTVTVGADGWLYYTATLNDYLGRDTFTSREVQDLIRNLKLIRDYAKSQSADFLFTIAPNKNTLYPEHMPYYDSLTVSAVHNRDLVRTALEDSGVPYADLFDVLSAQDEVLYFARDSHWNNKGALLAYDTILTVLGKTHDDYSTAIVTKRRDFIGDLSKMLYPSGGEAEYNYYYGAEDRYTYTTPTKSTEDARIVTRNPNATGSLYMYRDSFGNALVPFFASAYGDATFTKAFPMLLENELKAVKPDTFILELVERNLDWLITRPPVMPSPRLSGYTPSGDGGAEVALSAEPCLYSKAYVQFGGEIDSRLLKDDDIILVAVTDPKGATQTYECYGLRADGDKTGFIAYARADDYPVGTELNITIIKQNGSTFTRLADVPITVIGG